MIAGASYGPGNESGNCRARLGNSGTRSQKRSLEDQRTRLVSAERIRCYGEMTPESQKTSAHHVVTSLNVIGGFLAGAHLEFADGLNCLIGGRGAGKTTALEFLRFGLGLMPDAKTNLQRYRAIDRFGESESGKRTTQYRTPDQDGHEVYRRPECPRRGPGT